MIWYDLYYIYIYIMMYIYILNYTKKYVVGMKLQVHRGYMGHKT